MSSTILNWVLGTASTQTQPAYPTRWGMVQNFSLTPLASASSSRRRLYYGNLTSFSRF